MKENEPHNTKKNTSSDSANGIETRINAVASLYKTRKYAASAAGISTDSLQRYIRGDVQPSFESLTRLASGVGVSLEWLATGKGSMRSNEIKEPQPMQDAGVEFTLVPQYDVEASAGRGAVVERESEIGKLAFRHDWIRQKGLSSKDLVVIRISGDSMSPTIRDNALALVDTRKEEVKEEGIYVLMVDDHLIAKRLQRDFRGGVYIKSDNPMYEQQHLTGHDAEQLYIIGKVVWAGGEL